jgi:hypothetical protein
MTPGGRWALGASYLLMLWFVSSLARGKGCLVFALGLVVGAVAALASRRRGRQVLYGVWYALFLAAVTVGAIEGVLRSFPGVLKGRVANFTYTGYHADRDGIYQWDPEIGVAMRARVSRPMYWNGHTWRHETNAHGFRGASVDRADAVFLGDSMVYGHGLPESSTISEQFRARTGSSVANLGQQGTCPLQSFVLLRRHATRLRPRWIFLSVHPNDVRDAVRFYSSSELHRFVASPAYSPRARPELMSEPSGMFQLWARHVAIPLYAGRMATALIKNSSADESAAPNPFEHGAPTTAFKPSREEIAAPFPPASASAAEADTMGWEANRVAMGRIQELADASGAALVVYDLGYPTAFSASVEGEARRLGAIYSDAGRAALDHAMRDEDVYLPADGHWSHRGAGLVAEALAATTKGPRR